MITNIKKLGIICCLGIGILFTEGLSANLYTLPNNKPLNIKQCLVRPAFNELIKAIGKVESGNRHWVTGKAGEMGKYQISKRVWNSFTPKLYGRKLPYFYAYKSEYNERVAKEYLKYLMIYLDKKNALCLDNLLICYNWGMGNWYQWNRGKKRLHPNAKRYVRKIRNELNA